jgi:hypothetical protein
VAGAGAMLDKYGNGNKFTQWHMEDTNAFASGRQTPLMTMIKLIRDCTYISFFSLNSLLSYNINNCIICNVNRFCESLN